MRLRGNPLLGNSVAGVLLVADGRQWPSCCCWSERAASWPCAGTGRRSGPWLCRVDACFGGVGRAALPFPKWSLFSRWSYLGREGGFLARNERLGRSWWGWLAGASGGAFAAVGCGFGGVGLAAGLVWGGAPGGRLFRGGWCWRWRCVGEGCGLRSGCACGRGTGGRTESEVVSVYLAGPTSVREGGYLAGNERLGRIWCGWPAGACGGGCCAGCGLSRARSRGLAWPA